MHRVAALGAAVLPFGLVGDAAGIVTDAPGRPFSVTAIVAGIGLVVLGHSRPEVDGG